MLRYHARSVGSRTTCTVRAETTQDGTIHAWMVCICLLCSIQTDVVEMCLIGTRGCALSLSTCRVRFRDTQRASSSQTAAWRIGGSPNLIIASCNGLRAIQCERPSWATTALLRLSHVLEHTSASKNDVPGKCFRLQATRCIMLILTMQDIQERFVILHQHVLQLDSSLCSEQDACYMFGTNCPSLGDRPGATSLYACHAFVFCDASSFSLSPSCCASANEYELSPFILRE